MYNQSKNIRDFDSLFDMLDYLAKVRWNGVAECPYCANEKTYRLNGGLNNEGISQFKIPYGFNEKVVDNYYSNKSIEGVITEIGDKDLDPKNLHIYISANTDFKIFISIEQHDELKKYYRGQKVRVKLRLKKSLQSDKILSAKLISYKAKTIINFPFNLENIDLSNLKLLNE